MKGANRFEHGFGWEMSARRRSVTPAQSRTEGYTYDAEVWTLSIVQDQPFAVPCQTLPDRFATFSSLYGRTRVRCKGVRTVYVMVMFWRSAKLSSKLLLSANRTARLLSRGHSPCSMKSPPSLDSVHPFFVTTSLRPVPPRHHMRRGRLIS